MSIRHGSAARTQRTRYQRGSGEEGEILGGLALPTVVVQEGGYDLGALGTLVAACLEGLS